MKSVSKLIIIAGLLVLSACGEGNGDHTEALPVWTEGAKSCGANPNVDVVVTQCLNQWSSLTEGHVDALAVKAETCLAESFTEDYLVFLQDFELQLNDINSASFSYLDGATTCTNAYSR